MADRAEGLASQFDTLFLSVLVPVDKTEASIQRIRAALLRRAFAPAGIWSVETGGKMGGLHLNIIAPAPIDRELRDCRSWSAALTTTARAAAAYINKREGFPSRTEYSGHLAGSWTKIADLCTDSHMCPTVQAAAVEAALSQHGADHYLRAALASSEREQPKRDLSRGEYHDIARANLPNLYAVLHNRQPGED